MLLECTDLAHAERHEELDADSVEPDEGEGYEEADVGDGQHAHVETVRGALYVSAGVDDQRQGVADQPGQDDRWGPVQHQVTDHRGYDAAGHVVGQRPLERRVGRVLRNCR